MQLEKKAIKNFQVEHGKSCKGLTHEQYSRLIHYLKNGYDCLKVIDEKGVSSEVTVDSLIEILEKNDNIKEIVIERISLNEATVHRLILEEKSTTPNVLEFKKGFEQIKKASSIEQRYQQLLHPNKAVVIEESENLQYEVKAKSSEKSAEVNIEALRITRNDRLSSDLFFRIKNHHEVFRLGSRYFVDIEQGQSIFGFCGDDEKVKGNSLYGLMAFISYQHSYPVFAILGATYTELVSEIETVYGDDCLVDTKFSGIECKKVGNLFLIKRDDFLDQLSGGFSNFKKDLKDAGVVALVDLPVCKDIESSMNVLLPLCKQVDSFTYIVDSAKASISNIRSDFHFMRCYGFPIKGVILKDNL